KIRANERIRKELATIKKQAREMARKVELHIPRGYSAGARFEFISAARSSAGAAGLEPCANHRATPAGGLSPTR
ncbi:MAG: hypothetical protein NTV04_17300, partial [Deltaproteobacteria bacterium]|nr:hypothetical protein [Deltaproteobacteria bacterium]